MFHSIIHLRYGGDVLFGVGGGPAFNFGLIIRRFNPKMMEVTPPPCMKWNISTIPFGYLCIEWNL
jgi:hypothetical protein